MKNRIIVLMIVLAASFASMSASAQSNKLRMELSYNVSSPLGSFNKDYISKTSFRGGLGEISYAFNPKFSLGVQSGYQSYFERYPRATYKLEGNQVVSAVVSNSMDIVPLVLKGTFSPLGNSTTAKVLPYVSAGAGLNMISYGQYLGEFGGAESSTSFAAQAGLGVQIPVGRRANNTAIKIGSTYNYVGYKKNGLQNLNNIGYNAGVVFNLK